MGVDAEWHAVPPELIAAGRQSFAANTKGLWRHSWTEKGLLTEQQIVSPAGEEGFWIRTWRCLTSEDEIGSHTEIVDATGQIAAWLDGTWVRHEEVTDYEIALCQQVAADWIASPTVKLLVTFGEASVNVDSARASELQAI